MNGSIPEHSSWWLPLDVLLVLAHSPDIVIILEGVLRALRNIPSFPKFDEYSAGFIKTDLAVREAALQGAEHIHWQYQYEHGEKE